MQSERNADVSRDIETMNAVKTRDSTTQLATIKKGTHTLVCIAQVIAGNVFSRY